MSINWDVVLAVLTALSAVGLLAGLALGRRNLWRSSLIVGVLVVCGWGLYPPKESLKLGLDLAGGTSLLYEVNVEDVADADSAIQQTIETLKKRVDPDGVRNLAWRQEAGNRIEIQMPRPSPEVEQSRRALEEIESRINASNVNRSEIAAAVAAGGQELEQHILVLERGVGQRAQLLRELAAARQALDAARADLKAVADDEDKRIELAGIAAAAEQRHDAAMAAVIATNVSINELRRVLNAPDKAPSADQPSPRQRGVDQLLADHPARAEEIKQYIQAYEAYQQVKGPLDDPTDLIRLLQGAGVLEFRITVQPSEAPNADDLRQQLQSRGPTSFTGQPMVWVKIDDPSMFAEDATQLEAMRRDPVGYLSARGLIGSGYGQDFYVLCWNTPDRSLTKRAEQGGWAVENVWRTVDPDTYYPAVSFSLNSIGARLMSQLSGPNVGRQMAMILDNSIISAPAINSRLGGGSVIITGGRGGFTQREQEYLVRTMGAGSLQARLSNEPIAIRTVGPNLGADNLRKGLVSAYITLAFVAGSMFVYYFFAGLVADVALAANVLIILGVMAMYDSTFTLPGIAGVILTIGMAVDANVLIYERIREEIKRGADMEIALRLGYQKALSAILDGNLTNLLVCPILYLTATVEVRGFAVTLGIGVLATLFTALFVSRTIFNLWYGAFGYRRKMNMLPLALPFIDRLFLPSIRWMRLFPLFATISTAVIVAGVVMCFSRGEELLDIEFRAGTEVAFELKEGQSLMLDEVRDRRAQIAQLFTADPAALPGDRQQIAQRLHEAVDHRRGDLLNEARRSAEERGGTFDEQQTRQNIEAASDLGRLADATVISIGDPVRSADNADPGAPGRAGYRSFSIISIVEDAPTVSAAVKIGFADVLDIQPALSFAGSEVDDIAQAPVYPITRDRLGDVIQRNVDASVGDYRGGVAILVQDIEPAVRLADVHNRLHSMRLQPDFEHLPFRQYQVIGVSTAPGTVDRYNAVAVVLADEQISYFNNPGGWEQMADEEWHLVRQAMTRDTSLSKVSNFTPTIARTLRDQAVVAVVLSLLGIMAYIWFRFGSLRWGVACSLAVAHNTVISVGALAAAHFLADTPVGQALLLSEFKINLGVVAAVLTIIGYSLNDTIVIFDRIRENRGKLADINASIIDNSINQTVSRTILTGGNVIAALVILYVFGGEAIRGFAFVMLVGVIVGTYSSIAIASPMLLLLGRKSPLRRAVDLNKPLAPAANRA